MVRSTRVVKHKRNKPKSGGKANVKSHIRLLKFNSRGKVVMSNIMGSESEDVRPSLNVVAERLNEVINQEFQRLRNLGLSKRESEKILQQQFGSIDVKVLLSTQRGLIKDLAKKAFLGVKHAIAWEAKHLPGQVKWVRDEFREGKKEFAEAWRFAKDKKKLIETTVRDFAKRNARNELDRAEVDDERDLNEDGRPDVPTEAFALRNSQIRQTLNRIDNNKDGVSDALAYSREVNKKGDRLSNQQLKRFLKKGSPLEKLIGQKQKEIRLRKELIRAEVDAPVSFLKTELRKNPDLILDLPDNKLKELALKLPKSSIGLFRAPSPTQELLKRRDRVKRLERLGL